MPKRRTSGRLVLVAALVLVLLPLVILARPAVPSEERSAQATIDASPALDSTSSLPVPEGSSAAPVSAAPAKATPAQAVMHLADITGEAHTDPYGDYLLVVYVEVHDAHHSPLGQVEIRASIWWPEGGPVSRTRITRPANGTARFHWGSKAAGHWKLCVDSLSREGYLHQPDSGEVPACAEWTN